MHNSIKFFNGEGMETHFFHQGIEVRDQIKTIFMKTEKYSSSKSKIKNPSDQNTCFDVLQKHCIQFWKTEFENIKKLNEYFNQMPLLFWSKR